MTVLNTGACPSHLGQELESAHDYLQSVIEQAEASNEELRAANEEIVSSNEELRSTNEELQMAREEVEATNQELRTVNEDMSVRNAECSQLSDDLTNVLRSVEIPIVILDRDLRLRRITPPAAQLLGLVGSDLGRTVTDLKPHLHVPDFEQLIGSVLERLKPAVRTLQSSHEKRAVTCRT